MKHPRASAGISLHADWAWRHLAGTKAKRIDTDTDGARGAQAAAFSLLPPPLLLRLPVLLVHLVAIVVFVTSPL